MYIMFVYFVAVLESQRDLNISHKNCIFNGFKFILIKIQLTFLNILPFNVDLILAYFTRLWYELALSNLK